MSKNKETPGHNFKALARATVLAAQTRKFFGYINLADQKAMGLIILNSIIIPIVFGHIANPDYLVAATVSIVACLISVFAAVVSIFPKRRDGEKPDGTINPFHYGDIGILKEDTYLEKMLPIYNDHDALAKEVLKDFHDTSRRILRPKFFWLKISYMIFVIGNLIGCIIALYLIWA